MVATRETFPSTPEAVPKARATATAFAKDAGAEPDVVDRVALAVSEAATNVVLHAYRDQTAPGQMDIGLEVADGGSLRITISDSGMGLAPRLDSPGLGLGLPLITQMTDGLEMTAPDDGGTRISMRFSLDAVGDRAAA